jgi:hypothetical protein
MLPGDHSFLNADARENHFNCEVMIEADLLGRYFPR